MANVYFELTAAFNRDRRVAVLGSGQAVVWHRLAILSKDGDWILRETAPACQTVLDELRRRGARYRPGAPLDIRWLAGGWSSHFEFADERGRRVRCDFFSRPLRLTPSEVARLFADVEAPPVVPIDTLLRMKQTQRAKDYAVIGELARRLPPSQEIEWTTDPDRLLAVAPTVAAESARPAVAAARRGDRRAVVVALAEEIDALQLRDRERLRRYADAARPFLLAVAAWPAADLALPQGHDRLMALAEGLLPPRLEEAPA